MRRQDIGGDIWVIPAGMTKAGREHAVPLSAPAMQILERFPNALDERAP
jgi:hypothetical protein